MKTFYSIFSGTVYDVLDREVVNLDEGQIPLLKKPSQSCKICYGRGYSHHDKEKGIWPACKCLQKCIDTNYQPTQIKLLPNLD